ncbi:hypothetical protein BDM02DRAFT_3118336 [Thelephora ganbajun]|uniref:Uncharacterized protein n=1 Tax=Thelephora ganbajun TaxID=370292 RepID=A0ACB6ZA47_THEGA|nr:hypothetical protein BDM02DRAFT_3118336 [Thelephora ganbajun]
MAREGVESKTSSGIVGFECRMEASSLTGVVKVLSVRPDVPTLDSKFLAHWSMP